MRSPPTVGSAPPLNVILPSVDYWRVQTLAGEPRARRTTRVSDALSPGALLVLRLCAMLGVAGLAFHVAHGQFGLGGRGLDTFSYDWVYDGVIVGSALSCLARGMLVREERLAWLMLGGGLAFDATGEIYYTLAFGNSGNPPIPSLADLFYLLYYPGVYAGLVLLVRARVERFSPSTWLDGAIAAMAAAAIVVAVAFDPILHSATQGDAAAIATNFAYPVGDLVLLTLVVGVSALLGWRPGREWLLIGVGLTLGAIADVAYLHDAADGTYVVGGLLDSLWIASALALGLSAWQRVPTRHPARMKGRRLMLVPLACALASLGVLVYGGLQRVSVVGLALAAVAVVLVFVRAAWMYQDNVALLDASRQDAQTDALTGLQNRRAMSAALEELLAAGPHAPPTMLVMFDLDGFKLYNDRFGHIAGDTLLAHLGRRLREAVGEHGAAFRLGGDEFCVLLRPSPESFMTRVARTVAALSSEGDGFAVGTSFGQVEIPREAQTSVAALKLADDRMYAHKGGRLGSARQQTHDVLLGVLRERQPSLHHHLREVGRLAALVGHRLGISDEQLDELRRAAELHDVGKAAVPDAILNKPSRLDEDEWAFMRRHTLIGERILAAAPALAGSAVIVRSSHERWDGGGYPDGLAGDRIPLGARIVHVCDAFDAMTSARPYAPAIVPADALSELERNAGTQFDPQVVSAFIAAWNEHATAAGPAPSKGRSRAAA